MPAPKPTPAIDFLAPPQQPGELGRLGPYRVLQVLGKGGMGMVFRAEDPALQRSIALKVMLPDVAGSRSARERFLREARAAAQIEHEHIIPIFQVGEDRGIPYIAMPFLKGMSVDDWLKKKGGFTVPQILRLGREIAKGLHAAHERGLIHRDIKPANLWLDAAAQGRIRILDFGLARPTEDKDHLTQTGAVVGTPSYMSPEQASGKELDHRSDLFSLGVVLFRLCAGRLPFRGNGIMAILSALATETPPPVREFNPDVSPELNALVMQLLEKDPKNRPANAKVVIDTILAIERERIRKKLLDENPKANTFVAGKSQMVEADPEKSTDSFLREEDFKFEPAAAVSTSSKGVPAWLWFSAGTLAIAVLFIVGGTAYFLSRQPAQNSTVGNDLKEPKKEITKVDNRIKDSAKKADPLGTIERSKESLPDPILVYEDEDLVATLTDQPMRFKPGFYDAWVKDERNEVEPASFEVTADGVIRLSVRAIPKSAPNASPSKTPLLHTLDPQQPQGVSGLAFTPDGKRLYSVTSDNLPQLWDVTSGKWIRAMPDLRKGKKTGAGYRRVESAPDGKTFAAVGYHGMLALWTDGASPDFYPVPPALVSLAWSPDSKWLAAGSDKEGKVLLWDVASKAVHKVETIRDTGNVFLVLFSPNGSDLVVGCGSTIRVLDAKTLETRRDFPPLVGRSAVRGVFSADGKRLFVGTHSSKADSSAVIVWDYETGKTLEKHVITKKGNLAVMRLSPDGRVIADGTGGLVNFRDPKDGKVVGEVDNIENGSITALAFSPDGRTLATGTWGGTIRLWDVSAFSGPPMRAR